MRRSGLLRIKSNLTFETITMEKIKKLIVLISNKVTSITQVFGILAVIVGALLLVYDVRYLLSFEGGWDYINNIIVEAHGLFFDLLVLGVLISIYERRRQKKEAIERDKNLIDDFRGWDEKEAMYRIVGAIKRLTKAEVFNIDLESCYLVEANLEKVILTEAIFDNAKMSKARFNNANLNGSKFIGAFMEQVYLVETKLKNSNFRGATMKKALLTSANLEGAILRSANLEGAYLVGAKLKAADISHVKWSGAIVTEDWIELLGKYKVIGYEKFCETFEIIKKGNEYHIQVKEGMLYPLY